MKLEIKVNGMKCQNCGEKLNSILSDLEGIKSIETDFTSGVVTLDLKHEDKKILPEIEKRIESLGFTVEKK